MTAAKIHLSLNVKDVERSTHWYEVFFGAPVHKRRPGYANFDLETPGLKLALQAGSGSAATSNVVAALPEGSIDIVSNGGPLNHLGILVQSTAEVAAAKERLERAGLVTFSEENVTCCYALQDKIWVRDPDGNAWEVYTLLDDMDHDDAHHDADAVGACCTSAADESRCCDQTGAECCKG